MERRWKANIHETLASAKEDSGFSWLETEEEAAPFLPLGCVWQECESGGETGLPGHVETTAANARLIAAAPELLSQLVFAVKLLSGLPTLSGTAQIGAMRDVIAKAKGQVTLSEYAALTKASADQGGR